MNREQFLLDRKQGIGGSDVASILGVSPFRTALEVYHDKTSPELVLDEPTEGLDKETERLVFENLSKLMENKTVILITHNVSLLNKLDTIIKL